VYQLLLQTDSKARRLVEQLHPECGESRTYLDAFELTIIALFLCLQVEEFVESETIVPAQYFLRLAWFMRESGDPRGNPVISPELEDTLQSVKEFWPDVPMSERECRQRAIDLYSKALTSSRSIETARDEVELILLIGRLYMSTGDIRQARAFIERARCSTRKFEQLKITSHARGASESSITQMGSDLRTMERMNEDVSTLFDDIKSEVREAQYKLAEPLLRANAGQSPTQLREILAANGIEPEFVCEFVPEPKPQPKGFFSGLFSSS
jgi:tetratricopeptide (TPR) repeat protein